METDKINYFKDKLLAEKDKLESDLKTVGRVNPDNPEDWEAVPGDISQSERTEKNEVADKIEAFEENTAILKNLEDRLTEVKGALKRIEEGNYGICEVSGEAIEEDRLEANPAARTSKANM